jgi:ribose 5-phosphate isomerase RpiB
MDGNSQNGKAVTREGVLRWPHRIVTAEALRGSLNGERELVVTPRAVITPLALDHLKTNGVQVVRQDECVKTEASRDERSNGGWIYAQERVDPMAGSVIQLLKREGLNFSEVKVPGCQSATGADACSMAREVAQSVVRGECTGALVFCLDPGLVCCVANKVKGIRAVGVHSAPQACRAVKGLAANFLALEIGKSTFFELRQILRGICGASGTCPEPLVGVLKELEGPCECQPAHGSQSVGLEAKCQCGGGHAKR